MSKNHTLQQEIGAELNIPNEFIILDEFHRESNMALVFFHDNRYLNDRYTCRVYGKYDTLKKNSIRLDTN